MSGGIQLSSELVSDVKDVLVRHDAASENDMFFMQYLTAISGYVLAHQANPALDKKGFLNDLHVFAGQVLDQMEHDMQQQPSPEEAFGIWKPGDQ